MKSILIQETKILAVGPFDLDEERGVISNEDIQYPLLILGEYEIIFCELPEDFHPANYCYEKGELKKLPPSPEELKKEMDQFNAPIYAALEELDIKSIRSLRTNDVTRIKFWEDQAVELRNKLRKP